MTREEINILQDIVDIYEKEDMYPLLKDREIRTIKLAVKALEQEPCEVSEYDKDHIWYKGHQYISLRRFGEIKAEQKPKTGHWINGDDKCPCCGKSKFEGLDADIWADWQPKYCPNCGAKMVVQKESEEKVGAHENKNIF